MRKLAGHYENVQFDIEVPGTWAELDKHQFSSIIQVLHFRKADPYTISVSLLALLFGVKNFHILSGIGDEYLTELVPLTNFLIEEKPPVFNHWPEIKVKKKIHAAPVDDLSNLGFGEWCFAYECYNYYRLTDDPSALNKLIAVIYRPLDPLSKKDSPDFKGDIREKFNSNLIEKRAQLLRGVDEKIKLAILAWFSVALAEVIEELPNVFPKREGDSESEAPTGDDGRTWLSVFSDLLGPKWGTMDQLSDTNAMFILNYLEEQQIEFKKSNKKK